MHKSGTIVVLVALATLLAFALAKRGAGNTPPRDGCTFERGRTVCAVDETRTETVNEVVLRACDGPDADLLEEGDLVAVGEFVIERTLSARSVFYGNSHVIESETPLEESVTVLETISQDYVYCTDETGDS